MEFWRGTASFTSIFGAAGSLVIILAWIYYSAQIFFLGAEFTQVYARAYGSRTEAPEHSAAAEEHGSSRDVPSARQAPA